MAEVLPHVEPVSETLTPPGTRLALAGCFITGILLAFLGTILPAWQHHVQSDYLAVSSYFATLVAGIVIAAWGSSRVIGKKGLGWTLTFACALASASLLLLAFLSPPFSPWWRLAGILPLGFAAGLLHTAIFHTVSPLYRHDAAATLNLAGIFFGCGCLAVAFLVSQTFYAYTAPAIQIWIATVPALFAIAFARTSVALQPLSRVPSPRMILSELRSPGAIILSLLLFFQFSNEWAIAGWLPLFLSQRLGMSPSVSILILALFWLSLLTGRILAQWILPRVRHMRFLMGSALMSMFACLILLATDNSFGAMSGVVLLGASFAPIYPLVVERIGERFPGYHPGFYNGIFSLAITGGLLAPGALGYFAWLMDVRAVMALPLLGSLLVFMLLIVHWVERRLSPSIRSTSA